MPDLVSPPCSDTLVCPVPVLIPGDHPYLANYLPKPVPASHSIESSPWVQCSLVGPVAVKAGSAPQPQSSQVRFASTDIRTRSKASVSSPSASTAPLSRCKVSKIVTRIPAHAQITMEERSGENITDSAQSLSCNVTMSPLEERKRENKRIIAEGLHFLELHRKKRGQSEVSGHLAPEESKHRNNVDVDLKTDTELISCEITSSKIVREIGCKGASHENLTSSTDMCFPEVSLTKTVHGEGVERESQLRQKQSDIPGDIGDIVHKLKWLQRCVEDVSRGDACKLEFVSKKLSVLLQQVLTIRLSCHHSEEDRLRIVFLGLLLLEWIVTNINVPSVDEKSKDKFLEILSESLISLIVYTENIDRITKSDINRGEVGMLGNAMDQTPVDEKELEIVLRANVTSGGNNLEEIKVDTVECEENQILKEKSLVRGYILTESHSVGVELWDVTEPEMLMSDYLAKLVCGFVNSSTGGWVYAGVDRNGQIRGISLARREKEILKLKLYRMLATKLRPRISPQILFLDFLSVDGGNPSLVVPRLHVDGLNGGYSVHNMRERAEEGLYYRREPGPEFTHGPHYV